jgi:FkbM family methyltransferase
LLPCGGPEIASKLAIRHALVQAGLVCAATLYPPYPSGNRPLPGAMTQSIKYLIERIPAYRRLRRIVAMSDAGMPDFLKRVNGVIHIGANQGQEARRYAKLDLNVIWIEPIPQIFEKLEERTARYPRQKAYRLLMTDTDGKDYTFHVSSNGGASSSIFELGLHSEMWPEVEYVDSIPMTGTTFARFAEREGIDLADYGALILDTQGAELQVLEGCDERLRDFCYVQAEVADFASYEGGTFLEELVTFMSENGFVVENKVPFKSADVGTYFDVLFRNSRYQGG